ncbi:MAG TPA: NAD(P)H-hydrate dehydratase [Caproiciproducens sp.]|nr:NAD(P)H-hydrate dehydratase [Caproiciproducens sp.]
MKTLNSAQSKELEKKAVDSGATYLQLMENAGTSCVKYLSQKHKFERKHIVVLCGKGNNGGDGYVIARCLANLGAMVIVILLEGLPATEISQKMFQQLGETNVKTVEYNGNPQMLFPMLRSADFIIDAVYGTGFHGTLRKPLEPVVKAANESKALIVSVDMPSGANCDTGAVEGVCVDADYTISFSTLKNGHLLQPARSFCGQVVVLPIGIDAKLIEQQESTLVTTEWDLVKKIIVPRRAESNKGDYGRLLCICGSSGMAGAAVMSIKAALRCGAGIVDAALPKSIYGIVASHTVEPVFTLLDFMENGELSSQSRTLLLRSLSRSTACLLGCGLGKSNAAREVVFDLLSSSRVPLIIDADGINILAENINRLKTADVPVVLTPHPGEMSRLLNTTVQDVQSHRLDYARKFASEYGVILVLKGAGTLIAQPDGKTYLNMTGNPGMAKGGSGDVLAGMIASFIAQGIDPARAAAGAAFLHGMAGDRCAKQFSQCAMLPTDMIEMLPKLFSEIGR